MVVAAIPVARHTPAADAKRIGIRRNTRGFTLIEVLLALAITALITVMAYAGLTAAINAAAHHGELVRRIGDVQSAVGWLVRDLRQSVDRPIVDARGDTEPAIVGTELHDQLLELTHTGWDNPRGQRRAAVQRVRYRLDPDGNLWRDHWLVLDRLEDEDHLQQVKLLSGVLSFKLQFLDGKAANAGQSALGGEWVELWPMTKGDALLPLAVQFDLEIEGIGIVHRVVGLANANASAGPPQ
jgi:general secretion pathway protein J